MDLKDYLLFKWWEILSVDQKEGDKFYFPICSPCQVYLTCNDVLSVTVSNQMGEKKLEFNINNGGSRYKNRIVTLKNEIIFYDVTFKDGKSGMQIFHPALGCFLIFEVKFNNNIANCI